MHGRAWFLIFSFTLAVVLSGISCYDDDYWDDDDWCHYDRNGVWHCHDDDDFHHHGRAQTGGEVVVLITDHPAADVTAFHITVTEVTFFETDIGPVTVYRSETGRRIDLLSLRGSRATRLHDLLAVREIPTGVYSMIRLTLRDPVLVLSSGGVLEGSRVELAGQGQIDVGLGEHLVLGPDETVRVILDIDAEASIDSRALPDRGSVRPVVLVDVVHDELEEELELLAGVEGELLKKGSESDLFHLELPEDRGGLKLKLLESSEVLDHALEPAPPSVLADGSRVVARGVLRSTGELEIERIAPDPGSGRTLPPGERGHPAPPPDAPVEGIVSAVMTDDRALEIDLGDTRQIIQVSPETVILSVQVAEDGVSQTEILLRQVEVGANLVVHGEEGAPARLVVVTAGG